jgi:threonine/homoserine/homoserine lactone efflux protein
MHVPFIIHELAIAGMLGLIGGVIPGPVITAIFTEIIQSGFPQSLRIVGIAFITETLVAVASLLLFTMLGLPESFFRVLSFAGAGILLWIAVSIWKVSSLDTGQKLEFTPGKIILMILSNGILWTYWITICIPKAILLDRQLTLGAYVFMGIVQLGWLVSTLLVAFLFSRFRSLLSKPAIVPLLFKIFSLAFVYFAADMTYRSIRFFIR